MYMYEDDIHMNMPVEVTLECENKILEYNDVGERPFVPMYPVKRPYNFSFKRKEKLKRRGRKKNTYVQRTFFLFSHCNPVHFPTKKERIMLTAHGLGKKGPIDINRNWSMAEMDKHLSEIFNIPVLNIMGFSYFKNDIKRRLIRLNITSVDQLEREVPAGGLVLLVPNQDIPLNGQMPMPMPLNGQAMMNGEMTMNGQVPMNGLNAPIKCEILDEEENNPDNMSQEQHHRICDNGEVTITINNISKSQMEQKNPSNGHSADLLTVQQVTNDNSKQTPAVNYKREMSLLSDEEPAQDPQYNSVTKSLRDEIFDLKLQLNSSKQIRASLELQLCRKEEIILKTSDQLAKANEELWRLKNFIKRLSRNPEVPPPQSADRNPQNLNTTW